MNMESKRLVLAGAMIGVLALSATVFAESRPPGDPAPTTAPAWEARGQEAAAVMATEAPQAGPFYAALRVEEGGDPDRLFLCDGAGNPLAPVEPDEAGDAVLGPLYPGEYLLCRGLTEAGAFTLLDNAALTGTRGLVWTDGELLHLAPYEAGTAVLVLELPAPGYYSLGLVDRNGLRRSRDLFIPDSALPDRGRAYLRTLPVPGLPPGVYTLVYRGDPLGQFTLAGGEEVRVEAKLGNGD